MEKELLLERIAISNELGQIVISLSILKLEKTCLTIKSNLDNLNIKIDLLR